MNVGGESNPFGRPNPVPNAWDKDDLSLSSDFEVDCFEMNERRSQFELKDVSHESCIRKEEYEREKQQWERDKNALNQHLENTANMLESMKTIDLENKKLVEKLEKEKNEALEYRDTFEKLQEQIVTLNNMLYEANNETEVYKCKVKELKENVEDLEDKLYGPTNYYYKLYLESQKEVEQHKQEKEVLNEQLRQVKDILRNMIIEKSKAPTEDDLIRERQSFAREIAVYEKRISKLQEENDKLRNQH